MVKHLNIFRFLHQNRHVLLFNTAYLIAAADLTSIAIGGGNVRLAWALLPLLILLLPPSRDHWFTLLSVGALYGIHLLASLASGEFAKGFIFSSWIIANYVLFFRVGYSLAKKMGNQVWDAFLTGGRLQIVIGISLYLLGLHDRTRFTYYEPSYLAIGLVPYLFCVVFWSKKKFLDYSLLVLVFISSQSANMLIAILVAILLSLIYSRKFIIFAFIAAAIPISAYSAYWLTLRLPESPNYGLAYWVSENGVNADLLIALLGRAGNRVPRMQAAVEMLSGHWWLGIGPGRYVEISSGVDFGHITNGIEYNDPSGLPVINVILEVITNSGILGACILIIYSLYFLLRVCYVRDRPQRWLMIGALFAFFLMLQIESSYLRAYVWFTFGVFLACTPPLSFGAPARLAK